MCLALKALCTHCGNAGITLQKCNRGVIVLMATLGHNDAQVGLQIFNHPAGLLAANRKEDIMDGLLSLLLFAGLYCLMMRFGSPEKR